MIWVHLSAFPMMGICTLLVYFNVPGDGWFVLTIATFYAIIFGIFYIVEDARDQRRAERRNDWKKIPTIYDDFKAIKVFIQVDLDLGAHRDGVIKDYGAFLRRCSWLVSRESRKHLEVIADDLQEDAVEMIQLGKSLRFVRFATLLRSVKELIELTMAWVKSTFYRSPSVDKFKT
jgi:hypothetical protein